MKTEKEKMLTGELYDSMDTELIEERVKAKEILYDYNCLRPLQTQKRIETLRNLLGSTGDLFIFEQPFQCDYGYNIQVGENFCANMGCIILDEAKVTFGNNVLIGPNVGIYTAGHPENIKNRNAGLEYAYPITIGHNVWIGGNVVITPGVTIGDNTIIGAGSIVTKSIPSDVIAVGNPCRILRKLNPC